MSYVLERVRCREHKKVFNGELFPLLDRWYWACTECLATGSDKLKEAPELDPVAYWKAMRQLKPDCWVPAKYNR
jgi:hypothetical protein